VSARATLSWRSAAQKRRYAAGLDAVEGRLEAVAAGYPGRLGQACCSTLGAGGKRLRPLLSLLSSRRDAELSGPVLRAAAAVELLHMATLVHDDVLDHAVLRRGHPTVVQAYGAGTAVSAGNYLLARAFVELAGAGSPEAIDALSGAALQLSRGELLQRGAAHKVTTSVAEYEERCERKTADLFAAACSLGALLSGVAPHAAASLAVYGRLLGLAFQVFDDILDVSGDEDQTGKRLGTDVRDGTVTLPLIFALEARPKLGALLAQPGLAEAQVAEVIAAVRATGAVERAHAVAVGYIEQARRALDQCDDEVERELLVELAGRVVDRYS
jgi:geranylgeranyl pyrophosphate synthase